MYVVEAVESLGIRVASGSRLHRMREVLTRSRAVIQPGDPGFETALEAERDLQVLSFVFDMAHTHATDSRFRDIVSKVVSDSALPQDNRNHSKGRDMQFELFVAAVCQNAGLTPVEREEPDVSCTVNGTKFGIAAKRLKGIGNLRKRVKKAADQIAGARMPGIIALETSLLLNPENVRITQSPPDAEFWARYEEALREHVRPYYDKLQEWIRGKEVRGIVFHDQQIRLESNGEWCLVGMTMSLCTARHNQRRNREFQQFDRQYRRGLPNRQNVVR